MKNQSYESTVASRCQGIAATLSYNDKPESVTKHTLHEASHIIDSHVVRVHKKKDGLLMVNARGASRYMTWRERLAYRLLGGRTAMLPTTQV